VPAVWPNDTDVKKSTKEVVNAKAIFLIIFGSRL
jgi:hypothetical protein